MRTLRHSNHLNRNARDKRIAGSLAGLGKSRLELLEQLYLIQRKIKWYPSYKHVYRGILCECAKKPVHRVQRVIFLTGGGFQDFAKCCASCSSVGKATLHRGTYEPSRMFYRYGGKND